MTYPDNADESLGSAEAAWPINLHDGTASECECYLRNS